MQQVWAHRETISLVLLDLIIPNMPGQEVLQLMKAAPELRDIPVIVVTADFSQEIVCLDAGASDFIQKPYPNPGVVQARVRRTIELSEDRQIIQSAERDPLTDLYNLEFFYSYGEQYDQHHKGISTDAIVIDINHFAMVNERFGRAYADDVLRKVGVCSRSCTTMAASLAGAATSFRCIARIARTTRPCWRAGTRRLRVFGSTRS